jgi:hypothetical protein
MGYTPSLVTAVWAGNNDNRAMTQAASIVSAPIWNKFMKGALEGTPIEQFPQAPGVKQITLDANTGKTPTATTKKTRTDIFAGWYSLVKADSTQKATIDIVSGKLATECTPPDARKEITGASITAEIPPSDPSFNRWNPPVTALARSLGYDAGGIIPTDKDDSHQCGDTKPSISISANASGPTVTVTANIVGGRYPLSRVDFYRDGAIISSQSTGSSVVTISDTPGTGVHSYFAKIFDAGYYSSQSNSQSVNVSGSSSPSLSCLSTSCSLSGVSSPTSVTLFAGGTYASGTATARGTQTSGYTWSWGSPPRTGSSASSNVYVIISGTPIYPN